MDKEKFIQLLEQYLSEGDIEKVEQILMEESMQKYEKIQILKHLIENGKYKVDPEKVAEKMLKFFENESNS